MNEVFNCYCERIFNKNNFEKHFKECKYFRDKFRTFDNKMTLFLKTYLKTKKDLCNFKFLLERFIKIIDYKIKIIKGNSIIDNNNNGLNINYQNKLRNENNLNINKIKSSPLFEFEKLINKDFSYVNSIFLSLSNLNCFKNWYNNTKNNLINQSESSIRKEFFIILDNIYNKERFNINAIIDKCQKNNIFLFNEKIQNDPFHFINSFLELFHYENNISVEQNENVNLYNINNLNNLFEYVKNPNIQNMHNLNDMYILYENYFRRTQKSIISKNFFNIIRNYIHCDNCQDYKDLYYFNIEKVLTLEVDKYSYEKNINNIDFYNLLKYSYLEEKNINCKICQNYTAKEYRKFFYPSKVLIIFFKRYSYTFKKKINFPNKISIKDYVCYKRINENDFIPNYTLKACISLDEKQNYFTYICINNNKWKRYSNSVFNILNNPEEEFREKDPQILIYELDNYHLINEKEKQNLQKIIFDGLNNVRKEYLYYQQQILSKEMAYVIFFLIPDGEYKCLSAYLNSTFEEIINTFYNTNRFSRNDYQLFICNARKLDPNSKNTLREMLYIYKINKDNIIINAIKGI